MKCRGHTGFRPGGAFRISEISEEEKLERLKKNYNSLVIKKGGCWDWKGKFEKSGYAKMSCRFELGARHAHKASYLIHIGQIPEGMQINHLCNNRECSNPTHIYAGTQQENMRDKIESNHQAKGSKNGNSKLDETKVMKIKTLLNSGKDIKFISDIFNVTPTQIYNIKKNKQWKHVEEPC